jgi:hypothetical protein
VEILAKKTRIYDLAIQRLTEDAQRNASKPFREGSSPMLEFFSVSLCASVVKLLTRAEVSGPQVACVSNAAYNYK